MLHPELLSHPGLVRRIGVLEALAAGMLTKQIATQMGVCQQTVGYHIGRLMTALEAGNRTELVAKAYHEGLLSTDHWPPRAHRDLSARLLGKCSLAFCDTSPAPGALGSRTHTSVAGP